LSPEHLQTARAFLDGIEKARIHLYLDRKRMSQIESDSSEAGEILDQMSELIAASKTVFPEVEFSPQDATRFEFDTLARVVEVALVAGASIISISDTVGTATPEHICNLFQALNAKVPGLDSVTLSLHAHNHEGRAVENVLAAIDCGVAQIEGTINGVGPAGGNTDLLDVVAKLEDVEEFDLGELNPRNLRAIGVESPFAS
jgi:2-isopropylmalate synthase